MLLGRLTRTRWHGVIRPAPCTWVLPRPWELPPPPGPLAGGPLRPTVTYIVEQVLLRAASSRPSELLLSSNASLYLPVGFSLPGGGINQQDYARLAPWRPDQAEQSRPCDFPVHACPSCPWFSMQMQNDSDISCAPFAQWSSQEKTARSLSVRAEALQKQKGKIVQTHVPDSVSVTSASRFSHSPPLTPRPRRPGPRRGSSTPGRGSTACRSPASSSPVGLACQ